jgi:type I restriction enzyme S subunit
MSWKKIKLGDTATFINGYPFKPTEWNDDGLPIIRIQNLTGNAYESNYFNGKIPDKYLVKDEDILISWSASLGVYVWKGGNAWLNQHIFKVVLDKIDVDKEFFKYLLLEKVEEMKSAVHGATMKHITKGRFDNIDVKIPDKPTQKHIASILDKADALRQQNRQLLAYYDALLQSTFIEMFGDPVKNLMGWEIKRLGDIAEVVSGVAKNGNVKGDLIEAPYMRVANVQDGVLNLTEIKTISVFKRDFDKYQLKNNDILMTEGGDPDKLGRAAIWKEEVENCIHQNHIFRVRPDFSIINSEFLCNQFGSSYGKRYFLKAAKQTTGIASINMTQLKNFPALLPPVSVQQRFGKISQDIEAQKEQAKASLAKSESLFQGLLSTYFGNN